MQTVGEKAYIVGNEMVFSYLIHNLKNSDDTLLCTSGQPRSVAQVLLPYTEENGRVHEGKTAGRISFLGNPNYCLNTR